MRTSRVISERLLRRFGSERAAHPRRGYSLLETMVASMLAAFLGMLLALSCASFGRSALEVESRARITQEGILAAQSLACDFGGFLADPSGRTGTLAQYSFTNWDASQGNVLVVYFQGNIPTDVIAITYQLSGNQLVRSNSSSGVTTTIARYVTGFAVEPNPPNTAQVQIQITVTYRLFTATYTLIGTSPT